MFRALNLWTTTPRWSLRLEVGGPFDERTARLSLIDGALNVFPLVNQATQPHLVIPPGTDYVRVAPEVEDRLLIKRVSPVFPPSANAETSLKFEALIGKNGRVESLLALSGTPDLTGPAEAAMRQWIYRPTSLDGRVVSVLTTIELLVAGR
jgi:hypothetical protein